MLAGSLSLLLFQGGQATMANCAPLMFLLLSTQVGLRGINGLYLFEIERANGDKIRVVDHDTVLEKGDVLWFAGEPCQRSSHVLCSSVAVQPK